MNKRNIYTVMLLTSLMLLAGCRDTSSSSSNPPSETSIAEVSEETLGSSDESLLVSAEDSIPSSDAATSEAKEDGYYKPTTHRYNNREVTQSGGYVPLSSLGDQKLLVVPIVFTDAVSSAAATPANKTAITKTFFGESNETGWESVASYYYKSSYGRLRLSGEVTDYFEVGISAATLDGMTNYNDPTYYVLNKVYTSFSAQTLKEYDGDGDGYVDAIWFVYMYPYEVDDEVETVFWAFQYFYDKAPNKTKPMFHAYAWASYEFMFEGDGYSLNKPDAHTFIHESGHLMSLYDYYDYTGKSSPAGEIDMMDYNIIDHNAYSKFVLNWVEPYVVTNSTTITLNSTTETGDFILINDNWNGHAYDEYIMIEFYTPTGLNAKDITPYYSGMPKAFSTTGVRIFHIDSRLMSINTRTNRATFVDEIVSSSTTYTDIGISNTQDTMWHASGNFNYKQVHLLNAAGTASGRDWYNTSKAATNSALFQTGSVISATNWKQYLKHSDNFNDGSPIDYSVEIGAMTNNQVDIIITKN